MSGARARFPSRDPGVNLPRRFVLTGVVGSAMIVPVTGYLAGNESSSAFAQTLGNLAILLTAIFALVACALAARRRTAAARGWALMTLAVSLWTLGQTIYTYYGLTRNHVYPFPSAADAGFLSFAPVVAAALFAFPRPPALLISRLRGVLDALVITAEILVISDVTVLQPVREVIDLETLAGWTSLAYPVVDVTISSIVFSLGMRQARGRRLTWLCLGVGLVTLAVSDSLYVRLLAEGQTAITGTPLTGGWMLAFLLIGLATLAPTRAAPEVVGRDLALGLQLIPYVPVLGVLMVLGVDEVTEDYVLLGAAALLLLFVTVRQVMIIYENASLTSDLEARVAARTAELNTLGSIVTSSSDAIVGVSLDNVITAWNPAAERLYGHRAADVVGRTSGFLAPNGDQGVQELLARAKAGQDLGGSEMEWTRPDGSTVPIAVTVSPIVADDGVAGISIFGQDIRSGSARRGPWSRRGRRRWSPLGSSQSSLQ